MKELKVGNKKYKLQYGYAVVAKGGIVQKSVELQKLFDENRENADMSNDIETIMGCLDELLLSALQKNHANEFGYQVRTGHGHDEALEKVDALLDKYLEDEDADPIALIGDLFEELEENGFLKHLLRQIDQAEAQGE